MIPTTRLETWASKGPWAAAAAFATAAFLESLFIPFVIDALLLGLVLAGAPLWRLAIVGATASLAGTLVWYALGMAWGGEGLAFAQQTFGVPDAVAVQAGQLWAEHWPTALVTASLTAIPDPLVAAIAGASGVSVVGAVAALAVGHAARFAVIAGVAWMGMRLMDKAGPTWKHRVAVGALWVGVLVGVALGTLIVGNALAQ